MEGTGTRKWGRCDRSKDTEFIVFEQGRSPGDRTGEGDGSFGKGGWALDVVTVEESHGRDWMG